MTTRNRTLIALAGVMLVGSALAGCTTEPTPAPTPSASASTEAVTPGLTDITDTPGSGEDLAGALADTTTSTCERAGDAWTVNGTVTNPTEGAADYRIYVSLLNAANDTRALVQVDVAAVEPGATSDWATEIPVAEDELSCILRVERYAA